MSRPKSKSMSDFLVTFFVDNRAFSQLLSDVLKNKHQAVFNETLGLPSDFIIPFSQEENRGSVIYTIKANLCGDYDITLNGQPCSSCVIHSGDYFSFTHKDKRKAVKALLIATSEIQAGYKKYQVSKDTNIFIGRTPINDISYDFTDFISREKHAAIHIDSNGTAFIEDLKRSVGVYVNGQLTHSQQLKPFDEIFVMGLSIIYMGGFIAVRDLKTESSLSVMPFFDAKMPIADDKSKQYFVNTPRILKSLDSGEIEVDAPPSPFSADETPVILTLGPSLTMSLVMLASIGVSITNAIYRSPSLKSAVASLQLAITNINSTVCDLSRKESALKGMGATLIIFVAYGPECAILNIGDSRAYHYSAGRLVQITKDNTEGQRMLALGLLTRKELSNFPARKNLSRYIGYGQAGYVLQADEYYPSVDDGLIVLCSDGLSDFLSDTRICEILSTEENLEYAGRQLIDEAVAHPNSDNTTVMLIPLRK